MLRGHHDLGHPRGSAILVLDGYLRLSVRSQPGDTTPSPVIRETLRKTVGQVNRQRHQAWSLVGGVADHDALIPGTLLERASGSTHACGNLRRLS